MAKKTILSLDDDRSIRILLSYLLREEFQIVGKENGAEGWEWLDSGYRPDLILLDADMPDFNGYDFLATLKSSMFYGHIPVIVLSASNSKENINRFFQLSADDFLQKPFNPQLLRRKIKRLLQGEVHFLTEA